MKSATLLDHVDHLIECRSILQHPFYVAWQRGKLTVYQLATYAQIYYAHVAAFPKYLQSAVDGANLPDVRTELDRNLTDELTNPKPHPELWLDFAESLGLDRKTVANKEPHPAAANIVDAFLKLCRQDSISALAALYAYESQQPDVARQKSNGLRLRYGIEDPKAHAYFEVHAEADIEHREGERKAIEHCHENGGSEEKLIAATGKALDAYWALLDGICQEAGIEIECQTIA